MGKIIDLTGKQFGRLTVLALSTDSRRRTRWLCSCSCDGREIVVEGSSLRGGTTRSCGCLRVEANKKTAESRRGKQKKVPDLSGQEFGFLRVVKRFGSIRGQSRWECECCCGHPECRKLTFVSGTDLKTGNTKGCGALKKTLKGAKHPSYKGGRSITSGGYVRLLVEGRGSVLEHRLVMEQLYGLLPDGVTIHHKNGIREDNNPDNLEFWVKSHPPGQRLEDQLSWARELIAKYGHLA